MSQAQCPQCGRAVSEADRAGGSCPWCGRVLTVLPGYAPKSARRTTPTSRAPRRESRGTSGWSYWWIPIVAWIAIKGMSSCGRIEHNSSNNYTPMREHERVREMLERQREFSPDEFDLPPGEESQSLERFREKYEREWADSGELSDATSDEATPHDEASDQPTAAPPSDEE